MAELSEQKEKDSTGNKKSSRSHSGLWFGVIIIAIVLSIAGAGYYLLMQLRDRQTDLGGEVKGELSKKIADYQAQLSAIQSQLATVESTMAGKDNHYTKALDDYAKLHNDKLESSRKELSEAINRLQRQLGKTRGDWLIADAEYLLSVANERLHLIGDVNTTRIALEAADQRLRESGDAGVFKVREQIAKELASLKSLSAVDVVGLYSSIQTLQDAINRLTLLLPYSGKEPTAPPKPAKSGAENPDDEGLVDSALEELEGMVTIRHTEQPVVEILTPEQAQFIREQLRIKLEIIKLALVQQNETIYLSSIRDAKNWLNANFITNDETAKLVSELDRLNSLKIRSHFPDISASLNMLKNLTKLRIESDKSQDPEEAEKPETPKPPPVIPAPAPASTTPSTPAAPPTPEKPH